VTYVNALASVVRGRHGSAAWNEHGRGVLALPKAVGGRRRAQSCRACADLVSQTLCCDASATPLRQYSAAPSAVEPLHPLSPFRVFRNHISRQRSSLAGHHTASREARNQRNAKPPRRTFREAKDNRGGVGNAISRLKGPVGDANRSEPNRSDPNPTAPNRTLIFPQEFVAKAHSLSAL
jgi:hypothetical protein